MIDPNDAAVMTQAAFQRAVVETLNANTAQLAALTERFADQDALIAATKLLADSNRDLQQTIIRPPKE